MNDAPHSSSTAGTEQTDTERYDPGFGEGGVPWLLLLLYLSFLCFFTWYTLEFQLPDFLTQSPIEGAESAK